MDLPSSFSVECALHEPVQALLGDISDFYKRVESARSAILQTALIYNLKKHDWRMPREILMIILEMVWESRYDVCWETRSELEECEDVVVSGIDQDRAWAEE